MSGIDAAEAVTLLGSWGPEAFELLARAHRIRLERRGLKVRLCGVINAKSGACNQDCKFCAQSGHNDTNIESYPLVPREKMVDAARAAGKKRAQRFGIVTSGLAITRDAEIETIAAAVTDIAEKTGVEPCASLGKVSVETLTRLRKAGLTRYHSNLETAESFFPEICTTRDWSEAADAIRAAKKLGMRTCSGGLIGLGESLAQRVELLEAIRDLDVDSVPLNFFHPVPGNRLDHVPPLAPLECLQFIAVARLMLPDKEIRVCGGRELNLRDLQSWALLSGADGLMVGGYLTTAGRQVADDLQMIEDAGFEVEWNG